MQILSKLALKNAMEVRQLRAAVLTTVLISHDDAFIKAAMEATQEYNGHSARTSSPLRMDEMLEHLVSDAVGLSEDNKASIKTFCTEYPTPEIMANVIHVCRVKEAFQKGFVKVFFALQANAEPILKLLVEKLTDKGGQVKRGQAPKGSLERDLQSFLDQLPDMLK